MFYQSYKLFKNLIQSSTVSFFCCSKKIHSSVEKYIAIHNFVPNCITTALHYDFDVSS